MASSTQTQIASASLATLTESPASQWKHDVFLSFRGEDTRWGFISHLYPELQNRGIKTFKDDQELQIGMDISPSLLTAIGESRSAIVVLSSNYASSTWCLDELTKILQCSEANNTIVVPIFYDVDPSNVRNQRGSFAEAFTKHEAKFRHSVEDMEKVKQWRAAFKKVANLSGFDSKTYRSENELIQCIVERVCSKLRPISIISSGDFEAFRSTSQAMVELMKALKNDKVVAIGVYGMGGVGKTSMVKHVSAQAQIDGIFHQVIMAVVSQSPDSREIQGSFADFLGFKFQEETEIGRAARLRKQIMRENKTLIILDDIWERIELSSIGIPSYNDLQRCNSKVLLTTRRLNVCHSMESQANILLNILSEDDSWNLFLKKARKSFQKSTDFCDVARKVARRCAGLPGVLIAVARGLGDKDFEEWKETARRLEMSRCTNVEEKDMFKCIKLSYDGKVAVDASFSATTGNNYSWLSPSGDFAFGFRQIENNDLFLLCIWFAKIPDKTIVWYANGDRPAPKGSTVKLTAKSGLVLTSPQGEQLWKSYQTIAGVVAHGVMNDTGNFVLEDDKSESLWETFKNPTDTMLPGQIIERRGKLCSRQSETNYARGRFQLDFQQDGNLVFSDKRPFYSTRTTTGTVPGSEGKQLVFNDLGEFYILRVNGERFTFTAEERPARDYYLRSTLNFDGVLAQYFLPKSSVGNVSWEALWSEPKS